MFGAWEVSPYWLLDVYGTIFVQVRRVGEGNRNLKKIWLLAGVRLGATTCACRVTHLGAGVLDSIYSRGVNHHQVLRHPRWCGKLTFTRQARWRGRTALPHLRFKGSSTVARTPRPEASGAATSNCCARRHSAAKLATRAMRRGAAEAATELGSGDVTM
jgi:hypothetical protein